MVRPRKCRQVGIDPTVRYYKPQGVPVKKLEIALLQDEELEALRLADMLGMEQELASEKMGISRSTFSRILTKARTIVAEALVSGKAIQIIGDKAALQNSGPLSSGGLCDRGGAEGRRAGRPRRAGRKYAREQESCFDDNDIENDALTR